MDARSTESDVTLLEIVEQEFAKALDMAHKTRAGEVSGYSNPFDTGQRWINHAHELLEMRDRILGRGFSREAQEALNRLSEELESVRAEYSEMFRIALENGREAASLIAAKEPDVA